MPKIASHASLAHPTAARYARSMYPRFSVTTLARLFIALA